MRIDKSIKCLEDIITKWKGKIPNATLITEIKRDYDTYKQAKVDLRGFGVTKESKAEIYCFIDVVLQYHYEASHYNGQV